MPTRRCPDMAGGRRRAVATPGTTTGRTGWTATRRTTGVPGDLIQAATVPLQVDGAAVEVAVQTRWLPEPSRRPLAVGAAIGFGAGAAHGGGAPPPGMGVARRVCCGDRDRLVAVPLAARRDRAAPRVVVAAGGGHRLRLVALALGWRLVSFALVLLAALQVALWVFVRRDGAFRAIIPTDAPFWLDRAVMAAAAVVAVLAAVGAAVAMFRVPTTTGK